MFERFYKFRKQEEEPKAAPLQVGARTVPLLFVHHPKARRYLLRLQPDGVARVTVPRRGTISAARDFVSRNIGWLEQQFQKLEGQPKAATEWKLGTGILFRGQLIMIELETVGQIRSL